MLRGAAAGAIAATAWAAQQPADKRIFRMPHDDVELLGKLATSGRAWFPIGLAMHVGNGAVFGAIYAELAPLLPGPRWARAPIVGVAEHLLTWPLVQFSDRLHPARAELPSLAGERRAFWQSAWRHLLFAGILGELERRLAPEPDIDLPDEQLASSNGHGKLDRAMAAGPTT